MGGHGALVIYLNALRSGTKQYRSVSAFSPISNPTQCPWGHKALNGYLQGGLEEAREKYDATELISRMGGEPVHILIDYVCLFDILTRYVKGCECSCIRTGYRRQFLQARSATAGELPASSPECRI